MTISLDIPREWWWSGRPRFPQNLAGSGRIKSAPGGAGNTLRGLTRSSGTSREGLAMKATRTCSVEGCGARATRRIGMCDRHYRRVLRYGSPEDQPRPSESERFWAKVDRREPEECWPWLAARRGRYGFFNLPTTTIGAHRYAYQAMNGPVPDGMVVDHMCRNPICVNPNHLQSVTVSENGQNHSGPTGRNQSGVRGVWWCKTWRRWTGQAHIHGRAHSIGHHVTLESAAEAIVELRNEVHSNNLMDRAS